MGAALYIALETTASAVDNVVDGKALSRAEGELASLARRLGVRPLMEFFSMSPDEYEADVAQFNPLAGIEQVPPFQEDWFTAEEGLATVRALIGHMCRRSPRPFPVPMPLSRIWRPLPTCWRKLASVVFGGISVWTIRRLNHERPNKGMKQTSVELIGRSQLIPGVGRT